nr:4-hydroxy-tetrahydrodipicolinate synthase [bacterium]
MHPIFTGCATALCTPFTPDGVNLHAMGKLLDFQMSSGADALVVTGTTGEPSTMSLPEKMSLWRFCLDRVGGKIPVIVGCGSNNTARAAEEAVIARDMGADALLVVTPYYNKTTPNGLVAHYKQIAKAGLPIIVYNVPGRTGYNLTPQLLMRLADEIPEVVSIKEASGNITQMQEMARLAGNRLCLYSGEDGLVLPAMALGYQGVISVVGNVAPGIMHDLVARFLSGDVAGAREIQFRLAPLVAALFSEVNPVPAKAALGLMGFDMGPLRLPLTDIEPGHLAQLSDCMRELALI